MKKLFIGMLAVAATQALAPAVAQADEWVGLGTGAYQPGLLDYYSDEYSELLEAAVYESSEREGVYRFVPTSPGGALLMPYEVIVHAADPEKVWCENASFFRGIMNLSIIHKVKEASSYDNDANYGKMADGVISFATPNSFVVAEMMGHRNTNINGNFALYFPGSAPGGDPCVNDTWEVMGTGRYVEGLMDCECRPGRNWDIEIERSVETPGCYRFKPYVAGNPSFPDTPELADTYIYVHAENDMEVYTSDFVLLNNQGAGYKVQHRAVMASDPDPAYYGILEDGIITFPANSHYAEVVGVQGMGRQLTNTSGQALIALPGADYKDYYLDAEVGICAQSNEKGFCKFSINITGGADVAGAMLVVEAGAPEISDADIQGYIDAGNSIFPSAFFGFTMAPNFPMAADVFNTNRWTIILIALDQAGAPHGYITRTFFTPEDDDNWEDYAKGEFTDLILGPAYTAINETMPVTVQRKKGTAGMLRIVNPYAAHPVFSKSAGYYTGHNDHNHYLYINAVDPDYVYIEESAVGLNLGYGDVVASSAVGTLLNKRNSIDEIKGMGVEGGRLVNGNISFPTGSLYFFETKYKSGMLQGGGDGTLLHITEYMAGIEDVSVDAVKADYYDLRGVKVVNPQPGKIYIRVAGDKSDKIIF